MTATKTLWMLGIVAGIFIVATLIKPGAAPPPQRMQPSEPTTEQLSGASEPQTEEEKKLLASFPCSDGEEGCTKAEKEFEQAAYSKYPDIGRVRYKPIAAISGDKETVESSRRSFRRGLYFAKGIKLADGGSLFDFLTKCGNYAISDNSADGEDLAIDGYGKPYLSMQFTTTLKVRGTGEKYEADILLNKSGDKVTPRNDLGISSDMLTKADFMDSHRLDCW